MVLASQMQEQEAGDGTNWVIMFAGHLLEGAEELIKIGLTPIDVSQGYQLALEKSLEELQNMVCWDLKDPRNMERVNLILQISFYKHN